EELGAAGDAPVDALGVVVPVLSSERALGAGLAGHVVLLRREDLLPLRVGLLDLVHHHVPLSLDGEDLDLGRRHRRRGPLDRGAGRHLRGRRGRDRCREDDRARESDGAYSEGQDRRDAIPFHEGMLLRWGTGPERGPNLLGPNRNLSVEFHRARVRPVCSSIVRMVGTETPWPSDPFFLPPRSTNIEEARDEPGRGPRDARARRRDVLSRLWVRAAG